MKTWIAVGVVVLGVVWWMATAPRPEIGCCVADSIVFDEAVAEATALVDRSDDFAAELEHFPSDLPPIDDVVFLADGNHALVTARDGKIWTVALDTHKTEPFVDAPLMALGIHEAPGDPNHVYFCASQSYGEEHPANEVPGLYRLTLDTRAIEALVTEVPDTKIDHDNPVVYADNDPKAPELRRDGGGTPARPLVVCDNLEVSEDGRRIYFSEPFSYTNASLDDAVDEAIALAGNGRLWRYDLDSGATRLIAEGFHFINGVLYDLHPGQARESSVIVTQTSLFQLMRFFVRGPKAGTSEVAIDSLTGTPDGMDRDAAGRIWLAAFLERGRLLTWIHENAWIKPLAMRKPAQLLLRRAQGTGVIVVSPDGSKPLYAAMYQGPRITSLASAVPGPKGIYLANEPLGETVREQTGVVRLKWPKELQ